MAFLFNLVMAYCFGAVDATDVLNYCVTTFMLVATFMLTLDSTVLIPEAMRRRHQESPESSMQFLNFFLYLFAGITLVLSLMAAWKPIGFLTAMSQFDPAMLTANRHIILWVIPVFTLQLLTQYTNSILVSYKYFSLPALWAVACRLLNIVFVLLFHQSLGVIALAQSLILGLVLQTLVSLTLMRRHLGWRFTFHLPRIPGTVWRNIAYTEIGVLVFAFASFTPVLMASAAAEGFVTAMNYAIKISAVPEALIAGQIALIVSIKLNELAAQQDNAEFGRAYERISRFLIWLCIPLAFVLSLAAPGLLQVLMLRGAYTSEALHITTVLFQGLVLGLPMAVFHALFLQALAAQQKVMLRNVFAIVLCSILAGALWGLVPRIGILNYPLIKVGYVYIVYTCSLPVWRKWFPVARIGRVFGVLVASMATNGAVATVVWWLTGKLPPMGVVVRTLILTCGYGAGAGLLLYLCPWNRIPRTYMAELWRIRRLKLGHRRLA
ncbi:MAG: lipid II flippase MurJ [Kiritimatiellae bacterium]|nr:lipid II flippase MurJ [Kiritimatiellia bacterium]